MSQAEVSQVRSFNRLVTESVGALNDRDLSLERPLGEARLLWEIGPEGCEVRRLRSRLDLDSGYLSRLLRSLEGAGLISVEPGEADRRVRTVRLTPSGQTERELLDERSDELARSLLEQLSDARRERLVTAMAEVERLLTGSLVVIDTADPEDHDARRCLDAYFAELDRRFEGGFDLSSSIPLDADGLRPPAGMLLVAALYGEPVGCGALRFHGGEPAEVKRMWVAESRRGLGIGRQLLAELERRAWAGGARAVRLETNRSLNEAISLYRTSGYRAVDPFNGEPHAHHWFEKRLGV